jgi:hypothetical protein
MHQESCIFTLVKILDIYKGGPSIELPIDNTQLSDEIPNIILFINGELLICNIPNRTELNYLNLSIYTHNMIKKY